MKIFALLMLLPCFALSQPAPSSVSGAVAEDSTITIAGTNFGANGPTLDVFDDFELGTNGNAIMTGTNSAQVGEWDEIGTTGTDPVTYSNVTSVSGSLSFRADQSQHWVCNVSALFSGTREVLVSWWLYLPSGDNYPGEGGDGINWKQMWVTGSSTGDDDLVIPTRVGSTWIVNGNDSDPGYVNYTDIDFAKGRWSRVTVWLKGSTNSTSADGNFHLWSLNSSDAMTHQESDDSANTLAVDGAWERVGVNLYGRSTADCHPTFDDVYIAIGDYARARVEIGDNATYTSCNNMTILVPTSWSATSIVADVYQGSFADQSSGYIFVTASDGTRNATGYAITIGAEGGGEPGSPGEGTGCGTLTAEIP